MRHRQTHTMTTEQSWLKSFSQDVHTLLSTSCLEQLTDPDFVAVPSRRRRPQPKSNHYPASQTARTMAFQLALVMTGVRRAYLLDQMLQREQVAALAQLLGAAQVPGKQSVVILCVRASDTDQLFVLNACLVSQASSVQVGFWPHVVLVTQGEKPVVANAEQREVMDLVEIVERVQASVSRYAHEQRQGSHRKEPTPVLFLDSSTADGATSSTSLTPHLPALAGWLLEYDILYSLASYRSSSPPTTNILASF